MAIKTNTTITSKNGKEYKYARITKTIGKMLDGTPIKKQFIGRTKSEAEEKANLYISNVKNGLPFDFEQITLGQMLEDWLYNIKRLSKDIRASSFDRYECTYKSHLKESEIAYLQLYNITTLPIQRFYNKLYNKGVSQNQIKEVNKLLKIFFNWCIEHDYIKKNPCASKMIELPGISEELEEDDDIQIFNDEEIKKITQIIDGSAFTYNVNIIVLLALSTGLRQGELLGLQFENIDLENGIIKVRNTLKKVKIYSDNNNYQWELKLQKPKTKSSIRNVDIPQNIVPILKEYLTINQFDNKDLIFTTETKLPIDSGNFARAWRRFLKRAEVPYKKFHALRHTYASILFKNGANVLEVKELLGHSDSKTTEKIYIHVCPQSKKDVVNKINFFFDKTKL